MSTLGLPIAFVLLAHAGGVPAAATADGVPGRVPSLLDDEVPVSSARSALLDDDVPPLRAPDETPVPLPDAPVTTPVAPDAPEAASPLPEPAPPLAGYAAGRGFFLRSSDDAFRLRLRLQSAIRAEGYLQDGRSHLANPFLTVRPVLDAHLYRPWIRFWTSVELASNPAYLLDSYVEVQPASGIGLRVGQQWTPFARHAAVQGPQDLAMPEWSSVASYFWSGRDKGLTLFGHLADRKFDWSLGAYLGLPLRRFTPIRGNYLFVARVAMNPMGPLEEGEVPYASAEKPKTRYAIGVSAYTAKQDRSVENLNPSTFMFDTVPDGRRSVNHTIGVDVAVQTSRFSFLGEGYFRYNDARNQSSHFSQAGAFAQAGVMVFRRDLDFAVRGSWADVNLDVDNTRTLAGEASSTYYVHGSMLAMKLRYGLVDQTGVGNGATAGPAELPITPGRFHILTLQLNAAF